MELLPCRLHVCRSCTKSEGCVFDNSEVLDVVYIHDLSNHRAGRNDSWLVTLQLNRQPVSFKMDTGADVTVIPMSVLHRQRETKTLYPAQKRLHGPNNQELPVRGCLKATLAYAITWQPCYRVLGSDYKSC